MISSTGKNSFNECETPSAIDNFVLDFETPDKGSGLEWGILAGWKKKYDDNMTFRPVHSDQRPENVFFDIMIDQCQVKISKKHFDSKGSKGTIFRNLKMRFLQK